jgi:hypothetical protein
MTEEHLPEHRERLYPGVSTAVHSTDGIFRASLRGHSVRQSEAASAPLSGDVRTREVAVNAGLVGFAHAMVSD